MTVFALLNPRRWALWLRRAAKPYLTAGAIRWGRKAAFAMASRRSPAVAKAIARSDSFPYLLQIFISAPGRYEHGWQPVRVYGINYLPRAVRHPVSYARLQSVAILKMNGFFVEAERLYRELAHDPAIADLALLGLADLLLVQANWTREISSYAADGIIVSTSHAPAQTWRKCTFEEAIAAMTEAVDANPANPDARWLLVFGCLEARVPAEIFDAVHRFCQMVAVSDDTLWAEACAWFALDGKLGVKRSRTFLSAVHGPAAATWRALNVRLVDTPDLASQPGAEIEPAGPPASASVASQVVIDGHVETVRTDLQFSASCVARLDHAEILPAYGTVLFREKYLLSDTLHHKRCHIANFVERVDAMIDDRALIRLAKAERYSRTDCIFIGNNYNYFHWILEDLPRLQLVEGRHDGSPILLHYAIAPWQYELLERLGIDKDRIQLADLSNPAGFRDLIVPSRLSRDQVIHPAAARYMRERLCPHADGTSPQIGKRLYLTRSGTAGRQLLNESEIIARLKAANFAVVDPGSMSLAQQIDLFADAEVIVSPGGGALTNLIFAPKDARVITLSAQDHLMVTYPSLAAAIGQRHWWCCGPSFPRNPNRFWIWTMFDYEIPLRDLDLCLEQAL